MAWENNLPYNPLQLKNEVQDGYDSRVDLARFCTIDDTLVAGNGDTVTIHKYAATSGVEDVAEGQGNTTAVEVTYVPETHTVKLAQDRFIWTDEQAKKDPTMVIVGHNHLGIDLFNHQNADIYGAYGSAPMVILADALSFDAFVDASSMFNSEDIEGENIFALTAPSDIAEIRKNLGTQLAYVKENAFTGYVGEVGGITLVTKKNGIKGEIRLGTKEAVTLQVSTCVETEDERDANKRVNTKYARSCYVPYLADETKAVRMLKGKTATKTLDLEVQEGKEYFLELGLGYIKVAAPKTADIANYYEIA